MTTIKRGDIHFVFVRPQFAANLGSSVRVMKNMGFENLILIRPECEVGVEARSLAMRGADILDRARFLPSLEDAAKELDILIGTTGRFHGTGSRMVSSRQLARELLSGLTASKVGIVMGSEDNGLRREELRLCQWLVEIPVGSDYSIINLAQATAIIAYELNQAFLEGPRHTALNLADSGQVDSLMKQAEDTLRRLNLPRRISINRLMLRLRKIASRAQLEREDVNMLHGLISQLGKAGHKKEK
ncbi:MAG TPA: RNA methyltransferase [Acidobacteriota bacterium]|nr:RNA methyltransferase [Acidobacteriota bacterium]